MTMKTIFSNRYFWAFLVLSLPIPWVIKEKKASVDTENFVKSLESWRSELEPVDNKPLTVLRENDKEYLVERIAHGALLNPQAPWQPVLTSGLSNEKLDVYQEVYHEADQLTKRFSSWDADYQETYISWATMGNQALKIPAVPIVDYLQAKEKRAFYRSLDEGNYSEALQSIRSLESTMKPHEIESPVTYPSGHIQWREGVYELLHVLRIHIGHVVENGTEKDAAVALKVTQEACSFLTELAESEPAYEARTFANLMILDEFKQGDLRRMNYPPLTVLSNTASWYESRYTSIWQSHSGFLRGFSWNTEEALETFLQYKAYRSPAAFRGLFPPPASLRPKLRPEDHLLWLKLIDGIRLDAFAELTQERLMLQISYASLLDQEWDVIDHLRNPEPMIATVEGIEKRTGVSIIEEYEEERLYEDRDLTFRVYVGQRSVSPEYLVYQIRTREDLEFPSRAQHVGVPNQFVSDRGAPVVFALIAASLEKEEINMENRIMIYRSSRITGSSHHSAHGDHSMFNMMSSEVQPAETEEASIDELYYHTLANSLKHIEMAGHPENLAKLEEKLSAELEELPVPGYSGKYSVSERIEQNEEGHRKYNQIFTLQRHDYDGYSHDLAVRAEALTLTSITVNPDEYVYLGELEFIGK